jgi:hypothetical protein
MGIKDVLQGLANPRGLLLSYFRSQGFQAARIDHHGPTDTLFLTVLIHDTPKQIRIPLRTNFTGAQIAELIGTGDIEAFIAAAAKRDRTRPAEPSFTDRWDPHEAVSVSTSP